jgi:hypothetical protein
MRRRREEEENEMGNGANEQMIEGKRTVGQLPLMGNKQMLVICRRFAKPGGFLTHSFLNLDSD